MALKGYIVEKYNFMGSAYTCNRLVEEAKKEGIELRILGVCDTLSLNNSVFNNGIEVEKCDFIINRYKWGKLKNEINLLAGRTYNSIDAYNIYINKFEQVRRLHSSEFIIPRYCLGTAKVPYQLIVDSVGSPFVAKGLESSMGKEIVLVNNKTQFDDLTNKYAEDKEWLFEAFIESSYGRDIRLYSIKGNVAACIQRKSQGDFRANVALGASVEAYEITPQIRKIAEDIYRLTGLDFLGIDLLFGEEKPYFCEINVMPGFEGMERASGVNVAREMVRAIKGDFNCE